MSNIRPAYGNGFLASDFVGGLADISLDAVDTFSEAFTSRNPHDNTTALEDTQKNDHVPSPSFGR